MEQASAINVLEKWAEFCAEVSISRLSVLREAGKWYWREKNFGTAVDEFREMEARDGIFPEVQPESDGDMEDNASSVYSRIECISTGYPEPDEDNEPRNS